MTILWRYGAILFLVYFVVANLSYLVLLACAVVAHSKHRFRLATVHLGGLKHSPFLAPVTIVVPARNEALTIVENVRALLNLDYPDLSVVVVNDGSSDGTLRELQNAYELREARVLYVAEIDTAPVRGLYLASREPRLLVVDKESGGSKADALNAGINVASGAFVCVIDADSILEKDALLRIMAAVHTETTAVVAAGGIVRVVNGCTVSNGQVTSVRLPRRPLELLQIIEYLRSFLIGREGWAWLDMLAIISGAFGVFRTQLLREIGGLRKEAIGEDLDLVVRIHRHQRDRRQPYRIAFVPDPACWTDVPRDIASLSRQRSRWQQGLCDVLLRNSDMLFRSRYGRIGAVALPYLWVFELFEPIIELIGYLCLVVGFLLGVVDRTIFLDVLLFGFGFATLLSIAAVVLEEMTYRRYQSGRDVVRLILYCFLEHFPYRQLHMVFRLNGMLRHLRKKHDWTTVTRSAFDRDTASPTHTDSA